MNRILPIRLFLIVVALFIIFSGSAIADWSQVEIDTDEKLWDVWGSSKDDVFIVGHWGIIYHYDGLSWLPMTSGVSGSIRGIWGNSYDNVFAVGYNGKVIYYNGYSWSNMKIIFSDSDNRPAFNGVWGSSSYDVYAVG